MCVCVRTCVNAHTHAETYMWIPPWGLQEDVESTGARVKGDQQAA